MVLTGGILGTESNVTDSKGNSIQHWIDSEQSNSLEEFVEEQEEDDDSESSFVLDFNFYRLNHHSTATNRQIKCRKVKRKLFILYKSYKIDCCKF